VEAGPVTFSFGPTVNTIDGTTLLSASAEFANVADNLQITLTNTATSDVVRPSDVLTAVFFDIAGGPTLTRVSAVLPGDGFTSLGVITLAGNLVVGGEWGYNPAHGSGSILGGGNQGISSTGVGLFGPADLFPGADLESPLSPDGLQYGIVSATDDPTTGNAAVTGGNTLSGPSVIFTLSGLLAGFDPMAAGFITNVSFLYGTSLTDPQYVPDEPPPSSVVEPGTLALFGIGLAGIGFPRRRKAV